MRRQPNYLLPRRRKPPPRRRLLWVLAFAGMGLACWLWWQHTSKRLPVLQPAAPPVATATQVLAEPQPAPTVVLPSPPPPVAPPVRPPQPAAQPKAEPVPPDVFPRPVRDVFEAQLAMARLGISSGSLDGLIGPQTRAALRAFQQREHLPVTGEPDPPTTERLLLTSAPCATYTITTNDLVRLQPVSPTWLGKSRQTALDYETILELVAEKARAHPNLIRRLNPGVNWTNLLADTALRVPDVAYTNAGAKAAFATISLSGKTLQAFDVNTNLLAHFPCSIAQHAAKRPVGELHVAKVAPNPNYTFDPDVFPESAEARELNTKLILPPGPNNPVGVAWISLDRPGYGIHGTPAPEQVGRTESHGCFRLANWNAEFFIKLAWVGMPIYIEP